MNYITGFFPDFSEKSGFRGPRPVPAFLLFPALLLLSCRGPLVPRSYTLTAPALPESWAFLGPPSWHIEWMENSGQWRQEEAAGQHVSLSIEPAWAAAVLAWPSWPDKGLAKGIFRPAGAILPFDCSGNRVHLSWQGGVDAFFYRELARLGWGGPRSPECFDWPRFRELFSAENTETSAPLPEIRGDPWLVNWTGLAEKTITSGFNRRSLVSAYTGSIVVPVPAAGPWAASSPFARPSGNEAMWELKTAPWVDTLVSPQGTAKVSSAGFVWIPSQ
jgi:hypothetical protein